MQPIQEVVNPPVVPVAENAGEAAYLDNFEIPDLIPRAEGFVAPQSHILKLPEVTIEEIRGPSKANLQDPDATEKREKIKEVGTELRRIFAIHSLKDLQKNIMKSYSFALLSLHCFS